MVKTLHLDRALWIAWAGHFFCSPVTTCEKQPALPANQCVLMCRAATADFVQSVLSPVQPHLKRASRSALNTSLDSEFLMPQKVQTDRWSAQVDL